MPVDGVYERLGQYTGDASNWLMRLGNQEKRETCFKTISSLLENVDIVDFSKEELDKDYELFTQKESDISHTQAQLKKAAILEEKISKLYTRELEITQKLPKEWTSYFSEIDPVLLDDRVIQKLKSHSAKGLSLWLRRKLFSLDSFKNKQNKLVWLKKLLQLKIRSKENYHPPKF